MVKDLYAGAFQRLRAAMVLRDTSPALATDEELDTLPPGLYIVADVHAGVKVARYAAQKTVLDIFSDRVKIGPATLYARVRETGEIPEGVESVTVRGDGHQLITQWVLDEWKTWW